MVFEWYSRVKEHYRLSMREIKEIFFSSIVYGFILSFRMWGGAEVDPNAGFLNWIMASVFVFLVMVWSISWQKIFCLRDGYKMHFHWWFQGTLIGLFITFISFGIIPFLYPGSSYFEHIKILRLGRFRYGVNKKDLAVGAIAGVVSNIVLAIVFSFFYVATRNEWVLFFIQINFLYAFFSMLPIPRFEGIKIGEGATPGFHIFFFGKQLYVFIFASILIYSGLIYFATTIASSIWLLIVSAFFGCLFMIGFFSFISKVT